MLGGMGQEIERKFLVAGDGWRARADAGRRMRQGYLIADEARSVRVRVAGDVATMTIKGPSDGAVRDEFEYGIPLADAEALLERLCLRPFIEKTRHRVEHAGHLWEVDVFEGDNAPLVVAEVELARADEAVALPEWVGREVTGDGRFTNARLVERPYARWPARERPALR